MDRNFPNERRKVLQGMKQCVKNISRSKQPPENPEDKDNHCLSGPAWVPLGLSGDPSRGTSILESKVKALKEKRSVINKQAETPSQERASLKKGKAWKGKPPTDPISQDAVVEPQAQIRTYLTDVLLDSTDYPHSKQEESLGPIPAKSYANDFEKLKGSKAEEEPTNITYGSPEEFRRLQGRNILDKKAYSGRMTKRTSRNGLYEASSLKDLSCLQKSFEEVNGEEDHLVQTRDIGKCSFGHKNDTCGEVMAGRLWRTESWDSLGSGGSNATTLSLAEKVEKNRSMLQEMLNMAQLNSYSSHELHHHKKETPVLANDGPGNGILANDIDWDSGVSLQDSEGYRAFVPNQELELSPRHEQAKQLLQRARMKARTNPLRASHNILPTFSQGRRDACGLSATEAKNFVLKDRDSHASGNLSDSSSGESSCGQQRKRGPSPSRVRFEDESARDAEVRYLERLQQRQKRVLDSVLLSLGRGPLVSKPDLSDYINGDLQRKENGICKPGWEQQSTGQAGGTLPHQSSRGRSEKGMPLVVNKEGKCSACGSYVSKLAARNPDVSINQTRNDEHKTSNVAQESKPPSLANEHKELSSSQEDSRTRPLGPKGTPLWILPSRQHVYTERIKETYIGEVTCIDDVDSALDSTTDTSDSYRTDSEETGTISQPSVFKSQWHGGPGADSRQFCPSEKAMKITKKEGERHWGNASYSTHGEEFQDNVPSIKGEIELSANVTNNCNVKGASEIKNQVNKMASNIAEAFPRSNQPIDLYPVAKKGKAQGQMKAPKAQFREPISTVHSQQLPSYLAPDSLTNSVSKKSMESSSHTNRQTNNLSEATDPSHQLNKHMTVGFNLGDQVPVSASTGKAHSSPMPYRRAVLTGGCKLADQDPGQVGEANELPVCSISPNNIHHMCTSEIEEKSSMQSPKMLSKRQLLALSTNNCNNTHAKHQSKTSVKSKEDQLQGSQKMGKKHGSLSSSTSGAPPVNPSTASFVAISLSLTAEETNPTTCVQSISREASATEAQKTKSAQTSSIHCKPLEVYPEPKKKQFAKKGGTTTSSSSSSASGLKKFFTTLSQNTKQRLGRFRCYSMEQIGAPEPGASVPAGEPGPDTASSPKMKKAPSLQSLRLVSPFCQPRKASSVQNLHSLLGKTDRSSLYLLGEPKDEAVPNRKAGSQQRRSLSVEDIGSPNLVRTVGRVVEVFPDGTSQLELLRSPQGNFGFRVSSGNGRPDTGIYVQEMADPNTAKLYAGLLGVGDEILEVNGAKVAGLGLAQINELLLWADTLSVRVLRQRPLRR